MEWMVVLPVWPPLVVVVSVFRRFASLSKHGSPVNSVSRSRFTVVTSPAAVPGPPDKANACLAFKRSRTRSRSFAAFSSASASPDGELALPRVEPLPGSEGIVPNARGRLLVKCESGDVSRGACESRSPLRSKHRGRDASGRRKTGGSVRRWYRPKRAVRSRKRGSRCLGTNPGRLRVRNSKPSTRKTYARPNDAARSGFIRPKPRNSRRRLPSG